MAIEQDELKLTVALDDQASAGLGNLQKQLQGIIFSIAPAQAGLKNLGVSLRGVGGHAAGLHGSLGGLARGGFVAGIFLEIGRQVEHMAKEFAEAVLDIKEYADTMVTLDQTSSRAAQSMGQFRANVAVFRESGVGQEQATKMLSGYANALADLQRPGGRIVQDLLRGQVGASRERMEDLLRTIATSSQTQGINAIRQAGRLIREEHERQGRSELGAASEASFFARLGMPGLENIRGVLKEISTEEERMYNDRRKDAERYQTSLAKQSEAWKSSVESIQSIAFQLLPIADGAEASAGFFKTISEGAAALDRSLRNTNSEIDKQRAEEARAKVVTPEGKEITAQESVSEDEKRKKALQRRFNPRRTTTTREGETLQPDFSDISETGDVKDVTGGANKPKKKGYKLPGSAYRRTNLLGGEVDGTGSAGSTLAEEAAAALGGSAVGLGVGGAVDRLPEEYEEIGWAQIEDRRGEAPLSAEGLLLGEQTERMGLLTEQVNQLNEYLAPELLRMLLAGTGAPAFHNAPMGGAAGESTPIQLPPGVSQPGGGAAAEAIQPGSSEAVQAARGEPKSRIATSMSEAMKYLEKNESKHAADLKEYMQTGGRNLTGDNNAWCARFVDAIQTRAGLPSLESSLPEGQRSGQKDDRTWSSLAYKNWGRGVGVDEDIREGDVFVKERAGGGHVGTATGNYRVNAAGEKEYEMLSGNIGGAKKGGGEVNLTYETIGGARGDKREGTAGAGHGGVVAVRRGEPITAVAETGPQEGEGKGRRLDPPAPAELQVAQQFAGNASNSFEPRTRWPGGSLVPETAARSYMDQREYLPGSPESTNVEDRRRIDLSGDPGGLEGTGGWGQPDLSDIDLPSGAKRTRMPQRLGPDLSEQLGWGAIGDGSALDRVTTSDGAALDRAANNVDVNQTGSLRVDVNAPAGTTVSAEGGGVFNQTETNRSVPMESAQAAQ
jgi:hypothetical protein